MPGRSGRHILRACSRSARASPAPRARRSPQLRTRGRRAAHDAAGAVAQHEGARGRGRRRTVRALPDRRGPDRRGPVVDRAREELVRAADELDRELLRRRVPGAGQVALGAGPYPGETIVPAALTRFMAAHPLVRVRVVVRGDWTSSCAGCALASSTSSSRRRAPSTRSTTSTSNASRSTPRTSSPAAAIRSLSAPPCGPSTRFSYPFLALSRYPPRVLQPMLATRQASDARQPGRPFPAVELASLHAVKQVLLGSDAIAPLTLPCVADELERGTLVVLATESWVYTQYGLVRLRGHTPAPQRAALPSACARRRQRSSATSRDLSRCIGPDASHRPPGASAEPDPTPARPTMPRRIGLQAGTTACGGAFA